MRAAATFAALVSLFLAAPALAQTPDDEDDIPFDRACMDEYGRNLCDQGKWSEIVTRFNLEPAEVIQRKGQRGIRVFTIDGYSNDMPVIAVLAEGLDEDGEPLLDDDMDPVNAKVVVRWETIRNGKGEIADLTRKAWSNIYWGAVELQELAAAAPERQPDADPVKSDDPERDVVTICLHSWVTVTESLTSTGVLRRIRNACGTDPVFEASFAMSREALRGFPHCNHIEPDNYRNHASQLQRCFVLDGADRLTAADVLNILDGDVDTIPDLIAHLSPDVRLTLPDTTTVSGLAAVSGALTTRAMFNEADLYIDNVAGEPARVTVASILYRSLKEHEEQAPAQQVWRQRNNQWRLIELSIGPYKLIE